MIDRIIDIRFGWWLVTVGGDGPEVAVEQVGRMETIAVLMAPTIGMLVCG